MDPATSLAELIIALGGPHVSPSGLASVSDTPAGRSLVEWMISQAPEPDGQGISITALRQIALEDEELAGNHEIANVGSNPSMPYATRSSSRTQAVHIQAERELLENQTKVLRARAEHTKSAIQQMQKTAKTLQTLVENANTTNKSLKAQMHDLESSSDAAVTKVSSSVTPLLRLLSSFPDPASVSSYERLAADHDATILQVEKRQLVISQAEQAIPSPPNIEAEVNRLQRVLSPLQDKARSLENNAYCEELLLLSQRIEDSESFRNELSNLLEPRDKEVDQDAMNGPNIEVEIQRAWMLDQYALLRAREDLADQANDRLQSQLLDQFEALDDKLKSRTDLNFETECLVNALLEELEEIGEDIKAVQHGRTRVSDEQSDGDLLVRQELVNTIKELQDYRPEEERPLVLLDDTDLESELKAIQERLEKSQDEEGQWLSSLASTLSKLSASHKPLLSAIYEHSPSTTSPPFSLPPELKQLESEARIRAETLSDAIVQLTKDTAIDKHTRKKMNAFVEKWGKHSG